MLKNKKYAYGILVNLLQEPTMNLAPTIAVERRAPTRQACRHTHFLGSAAGGPRRGLLPQAPTVQICVSGGAPAAMPSPTTRTRR